MTTYDPAMTARINGGPPLKCDLAAYGRNRTLAEWVLTCDPTDLPMVGEPVQVTITLDVGIVLGGEGHLGNVGRSAADGAWRAEVLGSGPLRLVEMDG